MRLLFIIYHLAVTLLGCLLTLVVSLFWLGGEEQLRELTLDFGLAIDFLSARFLAAVTFGVIYALLTNAVALLLRHQSISRPVRCFVVMAEVACYLLMAIVCNTLWGIELFNKMF